jgi:hypothetical protein
VGASSAFVSTCRHEKKVRFYSARPTHLNRACSDGSTDGRKIATGSTWPESNTTSSVNTRPRSKSCISRIGSKLYPSVCLTRVKCESYPGMFARPTASLMVRVSALASNLRFVGYIRPVTTFATSRTGARSHSSSFVRLLLFAASDSLRLYKLP